MRIVYLVSSFLFVTLPFLQGQSWDVTSLGEGVKPDFEIDSEQNIHFAGLTEADPGGFVAYGIIRSFGDSVTRETLDNGTFVGPVDLALSSINQPILSYTIANDVGTGLRIGVRSMTGTWNSFPIDRNIANGLDASLSVVNDIPNVVSVNPTNQSLELVTAGTTQAVIDEITTNQTI